MGEIYRLVSGGLDDYGEERIQDIQHSEGGTAQFILYGKDRIATLNLENDAISSTRGSFTVLHDKIDYMFRFGDCDPRNDV